jgi:60 kDa SS-A/Ro ribonucleoprotein
MFDFTPHIGHLASRIWRLATPQAEPIPGSAQLPNAAGGHAWAVDHWARLDRFLILGSEGGTFYVGERPLTRESATAAAACLAEDGARVVRRVVEVSAAGRAPRNDPALFVLAMAAGTAGGATRAAALAALPAVARTGTHLFHFLHYLRAFRGWGRGVRTAVGRWYTARAPRDLAYQVMKYQARDGWSHRDALRLAHPKAPTATHELLFAYATKGWDGVAARAEGTEEAVVARLGAMHALRAMSPAAASRAIRAARVHPLALLVAAKTYAQGRGMRGQGQWAPVAQVVDALDGAFYLAFGNVPSSGKRVMLALDVSGSMASPVHGLPFVSCREAAAAMALVTAAAEPAYRAVAFTAGSSPSMYAAYPTGLTELAISPRQRLDDVVRLTGALPFGGTDCALPMTEALRRRWAVDAFVVYTDSETWAGPIHPAQALRAYRDRSGIAARLVVVAMASNGFTIADPGDAGMLDVVGFDTATPQVIADFVA